MDRCSRGRSRRTRGRGRGATRRKKSEEHKEEENQMEEEVEPEPQPNHPVLEPPSAAQTIPTLDMDADISQLEAPTFTTISRGPPEPMLRLRWGHPLNLMGEKVLNPLIYCCDTCLKPILIYGRMIPCKHVFCLSCAQKSVSQCARCGEKGVRAEQAGLGTVFMCTHGGSRYGNTGCRRTYLSERDLHAHINHRHMQPAGVPQSAVIAGTAATGQPIQSIQPGLGVKGGKEGVRIVGEGMRGRDRGFFETKGSYFDGKPTEVMPARTGNLITIPIQEPPTQFYEQPFAAPPPPPASFYPPAYEYPPPTADTSVPPPWPGQNPQFYG